MKKLSMMLLIMPLALALQFCSSSKKNKAAAPSAKVVKFETDIKPLIIAKCGPCHTGTHEPYNVFANAKDEGDDIIRRILLNPENRGFMPQKGEKLDTASIQLFINWKEGGYQE